MPSRNCKSKEIFKLGSSIDQRKIKFVKKKQIHWGRKEWRSKFFVHILL